MFGVTMTSNALVPDGNTAVFAPAPLLIAINRAFTSTPDGNEIGKVVIWLAAIVLFATLL